MLLTTDDTLSINSIQLQSMMAKNQHTTSRHPTFQRSAFRLQLADLTSRFFDFFPAIFRGKEGALDTHVRTDHHALETLEVDRDTARTEHLDPFKIPNGAAVCLLRMVRSLITKPVGQPLQDVTP